jgi:hypothetical protein
MELLLLVLLFAVIFGVVIAVPALAICWLLGLFKPIPRPPGSNRPN